VVLVRCGVQWGSGVVVDSLDGIVLTCSHVVRNVSYFAAARFWGVVASQISVTLQSNKIYTYYAFNSHFPPRLQVLILQTSCYIILPIILLVREESRQKDEEKCYAVTVYIFMFLEALRWTDTSPE
jgi:hypothetical protein